MARIVGLESLIELRNVREDTYTKMPVYGQPTRQRSKVPAGGGSG
jgi:hypothetical protein